jgi:hypothetical protein
MAGLIGRPGRFSSWPGLVPGMTNLKPYLIDPFLSRTLKRSNRLLSNNLIRSHSFAISPRDRARFTMNDVPPRITRAQCCPEREQGMPGADAPAAARGVVDSTRVSHHGHTGVARHSPRNGFNGFLRALPGDRACLPPSPPRSLLLKNLIPASGYQDHATSPSAGSVARQARRPRPPHPASTSVTLRNAPLSGAGPNRYSADLGSGSRKIRKIRNQ